MTERNRREELFLMLIYMKGIFSPSTLPLFENNFSRRELMVESLRKMGEYMFEVATDFSRPNFDELEDKAANLSFEQCAQYMIYVFRMMVSMSGGNAFISLWKRGIIEALVCTMLDKFNECQL